MRKTCLFIYIVIFDLMLQMQAQDNQQQKSLHQFFDGIKNSTSDIAAFTKTTIEEDSFDQDWNWNGQIFLNLPPKYIESDNDDEKFGTYLNIATDEELRTRIKKDHVAHGKILLNDFFKTIGYKKLEKRLAKIVTTITSCAFLTTEESQKLRNSKIFYPNDYEHSAYTWEPIYENHELNALNGQLSKIIGLKGNKNYIWDDFFVMFIDVKYVCHLREIKSKFTSYRCTPINGVDWITPSHEYYLEPHHYMNTCITFFRQKGTRCNSVSITFYVTSGKKMLLTKDDDCIEEKIDTEDTDFEMAECAPYIYGFLDAFSQIKLPLDNDIFSNCSDFIIKSTPQYLGILYPDQDEFDDES